MIKWIRLLIFLTFGLNSDSLFAQAKRVEIVNSNYFEIETRATGRVKKLVGDVVLKQGYTILKCDSAYLFDETDFIEAYRNVKISHNDSVNFTGDELRYDSKNRKARLVKNVTMTDPSSVLRCDALEFDFNLNRANYQTGGRLVSGNSELTSKKGYYTTNNKEFIFLDQVEIINPEFKLNSDSLRYNTENKLATFIGKSVVISVDDSIYCRGGTYNTERQSGILTQSVKLRSRETTITADTIHYNRKTKYSKGVGNLVIIDTTNKIIIKGHLGETFGLLGKSYVTKNALVLQVMELDTMFIKADSIWVYKKTKQNNTEQILAYSQVRFFRKDMQAVCDSMAYIKTDSTLTMYKRPVLWSDDNQVSGDTVKFLIANRNLDSLYVFGNAFVVSRENAKHFNQIKGRFLESKFKNKKIDNIHVVGNSQSIYYAKEDSLYIGVNIVDCSEMSFSFGNGKIKTARFDKKPDAVFYPINELKQEELKLKGFKWREKSRPKRHQFI